MKFSEDDTKIIIQYLELAERVPFQLWQARQGKTNERVITYRTTLVNGFEAILVGSSEEGWGWFQIREGGESVLDSPHNVGVRGFECDRAKALYMKIDKAFRDYGSSEKTLKRMRDALAPD